MVQRDRQVTRKQGPQKKCFDQNLSETTQPQLNVNTLFSQTNDDDETLAINGDNISSANGTTSSNNDDTTFNTGFLRMPDLADAAMSPTMMASKSQDGAQ